jgi:hypothetical protein
MMTSHGTHTRLGAIKMTHETDRPPTPTWALGRLFTNLLLYMERDDNYPMARRDYETIRAALQQPSVSAGWKLVPIEPTKEMVQEGEEAECEEMGMEFVYKAMIAAAPTYDAGNV